MADSHSSHFGQMVRVCREFQKYTANDTLIVCNIDSQYAPKFHIHPMLLASDFFRRRKQFYTKLRSIIMSMDTTDELLEYVEDEQISFMLHHFGIQKVIKKVKKYKKRKAIQQRKQKLSQSVVQSRTTTPIKTESETRHRKKRRSSRLNKILKQPTSRILWFFLRFRELQHDRIKCPDAMSDMCEMMMLFGITASEHRKKLFQMIRNLPLSQLQKKLKSLKSIDKANEYYHIDKKQMISMCNDLRSWAKGGIKGIDTISNKHTHDAMELISRHFFNDNDCKLCHCHNSHKYVNHGAELMTDTLMSSSVISNNHDYAKTIGVIRICITNDLITRVEEMNGLAVAAIRNKEPFAALTLLRCSFRLGGGYVKDDTMDDDRHLEIMDNLNELWWDSPCSNCKTISVNRGVKHKVCIGCMKVVYCNRKCQKIDWNNKHRFLCDQSWESIYGALKATIFDRM
eukprot:486983_1